MERLVVDTFHLVSLSYSTVTFKRDFNGKLEQCLCLHFTALNYIKKGLLTRIGSFVLFNMR